MKVGAIHPHDSEWDWWLWNHCSINLLIKLFHHHLNFSLHLGRFQPQLGPSSNKFWLLSSSPPMILPITPPPPSPVDLPWFPELRFTTLTTTPSSPHVCAATPIITASKHGQNTGSSCHKTCIPHLTFSVSSACPQFRVASWRLSFPLNHDPKTQIWINLFFSHTTKNEWYLKEKKTSISWDRLLTLHIHSSPYVTVH